MVPTHAADGTLTVLYDEHCSFCTEAAAWLVRAARRRLRAEAIGSSLGAVALRDLEPAERYASVHVVDERGRRWSGAASLAVLARVTPGLGWAAPPLELFPGLTRTGYDWVARHRSLFSQLLRARGLTDARPARARDTSGTRPRTGAR